MTDSRQTSDPFRGHIGVLCALKWVWWTQVAIALCTYRMLAADTRADTKVEEPLQVACAIVLLVRVEAIETAEEVVEVGYPERLVVVAVTGTSRNQVHERLHGQQRH